MKILTVDIDGTYLRYACMDDRNAEKFSRRKKVARL